MYQEVTGAMEAVTGTLDQPEPLDQLAQAQVEGRLARAGVTQAHLT